MPNIVQASLDMSLIREKLLLCFLRKLASSGETYDISLLLYNDWILVLRLETKVPGHKLNSWHNLDNVYIEEASDEVLGHQREFCPCLLSIYQ